MILPTTVLITGANGQTANYLSRVLLDKGCNLLLLYHKRNDRIIDFIDFNNDKVVACACDLSDYTNTDRLIFKMIEVSKNVPDALIHTAAVRSIDAQPLHLSDPFYWQNVIFNNLSFAYNILRCLLPIFIKQNKGKIIMFGSIVTKTGLPNGSAYAAAKAGIVNMVKSLALELESCNITINAISPSPINTNQDVDYKGEYLSFRKRFFQEFISKYSEKALTTFQSISDAVIDLLDSENEINGQEIFLPMDVDTI